MDTVKYEMVVTIINQDGCPTSYGIIGKLTDKQWEMLFAPMENLCNVRLAEIAAAILGNRLTIEYLNEFYPDLLSDITPHFLESERVHTLKYEDWPKYPVVTSVFCDWN